MVIDLAELDRKLDIIIGCMRKMGLIEGQKPTNPRQIEAMVAKKLIAFDERRAKKQGGKQ